MNEKKNKTLNQVKLGKNKIKVNNLTWSKSLYPQRNRINKILSKGLVKTLNSELKSMESQGKKLKDLKSISRLDLKNLELKFRLRKKIKNNLLSFLQGKGLKNRDGINLNTRIKPQIISPLKGRLNPLKSSKLIKIPKSLIKSSTPLKKENIHVSNILKGVSPVIKENIKSLKNQVELNNLEIFPPIEEEYTNSWFHNMKQAQALLPKPKVTSEKEENFDWIVNRKKVPYQDSKMSKRKSNQSRYKINKRWTPNSNHSNKSINQGNRENLNRWPKSYWTQLRGSKFWTKSLLNIKQKDYHPNKNQILIKEFRTAWKAFRGRPEVGFGFKWKDKLARDFWLQRQKNYNKSQLKLLESCHFMILNNLFKLNLNQDTTGMINYLWQIKAWLLFLTRHPKLLDHLLFMKENLLNRPALLSGWHKELSSFQSLTNLDLKLLTLIWLSVYDYLFFISDQHDKWKGMRIILSGRVSFRKMGRARRTIRYWGRTKFADSKFPLQYTAKQIHTKFGVIGLKVFLR